MSEASNKASIHFPIKLNSHSTARYVVVVPYFGSASSSLGQILYDSPLFNIWCALIVVFIVIRLFIRKLYRLENENYDLTYIPFNTIGLSFGCTSPQNTQRRSENIIVLFIGVSSIFTGIFCSGILLQSLVGSLRRPYINSVEDLDKYIWLKFVLNQFSYTSYPNTLYHR